jgi:PhnB protein
VTPGEATGAGGTGRFDRWRRAQYVLGMPQINAYLHFDGTCREAMTFYKNCLGGELNIMSVGESPMAAQMPAEAYKKILHATLTNGPLTLMPSDMMGPGGIQKGNAVSLSIVCDSKEQVETFFSKLSAGGKVVHALKEEFFGTHGNLTDKYGMSWMFTYEKPRG